MSCTSCRGVKYLREQGFFVHCTKIKSHKHTHVPLSGECCLNNLKFALDVFTEPCKRCDKLGVGNKPNLSSVIWFSHGSWLTDPYHDKDHNDHRCSLFGSEVFLIKLTEEGKKNVLFVRTLEQLTDFTETFCAICFDDETHARHNLLDNVINRFFYSKCKDNNENYFMDKANKFAEKVDIEEKFFWAFLVKFVREEDDPSCELLKKRIKEEYSDNLTRLPENKSLGDALHLVGELTLPYLVVKEKSKIPDTFKKNYLGGIDWDKVREKYSGGVYFDFCKAYELGASPFDPKYSWYDGMDVESLLVWDISVFENKVYPCIFTNELVDLANDILSEILDTVA
jgi:hypothetical protein